MYHFTPYSAFFGGLLIGLSSLLMMYWHGRIAGMSGFFHGLIPPKAHDWLWRLLFFAGLLSGTITYHLMPSIQFAARTNFPIPLIITAGILVAFGTRMGSGCTSGHAICGLARFSKRSLIATLIFMLSAAITTFIIRHLLGVA